MKFKKQKRFQDVDTLLKAREINIPKTKEYLYDYKLQEALKNRQHYSQEEFKNKFKIEFDDLPISQITKNALRQRKFYKMTEIQRCTIPHALAGRDILGASRTGSGKTLAYLIPLVENLYIQKWSPLDKLGALIILPTRELAMQVAEVLNSIAQQHLLSTGLLIGGKSYEYEKRQVEFMNILICTPGRLLHHLEETPNFDASNLKILVLDEADEMLEMGFWGALKSIMQYLPKEKQTLLFSATLSKSIHQLSKISLINPETIFLHSNNEQLDTPQKLQQFYLVSPIEDKIDILYSFIRNHNRQKILIFVSTCKQVRFLYEAFRKLKIGLPLMELHGRQKQEKRTAIFFTFTEKRAAALFTTNIAARGLDFPKIDWVIQFDCPEDVETYVHRVGRTARYNAGGYSLLFLTPSEQAFTQKLADKKIVAKQKFLNGTKQLTIKQTLQSLVSENVELKYLAQRAFISYVRSIDIMKDKDIFNVNQIKSDLLAESFGLIQVPVIQQVEEDNEEQEQEEPKKSKLQKLKEKIEMKKQMAQEANKPLEIKKIKQLQRESDFQKFENIKYKEDKKIEDHFIGGLLVKKENKQKQIEEELEKPKFITSKRQMKKVKEDGIFGGRNKVFYDDEGNPITADEKRQREIEQEQELALNEDRTQRYAQKLYDNVEIDKAQELERRKLKRKKRKVLLQQQQLQ